MILSFWKLPAAVVHGIFRKMATPAPLTPMKLMTLEEASLLDPDAFPGEVIHGKWAPVTKGTWRHGEIVLAIGILLRLYTRKHGGFSVSVADPGVKLARNPDLLRGPDVAIVRAERVPTGKGVEGWLEGAPDVAVEVIGDSQSIAELMKKALEYINGGAKMVWLVDAEPQSVVLITPPDHVRILNADDVLDGGDVLPGFSCKVAEMFT